MKICIFNKKSLGLVIIITIIIINFSSIASSVSLNSIAGPKVIQSPIISVKSKTITVDDDGGENFTKIQDAINNANSGDTIIVYSGFYNERVVVDKQLIIIGMEKNEEGLPVVEPVGNYDTIQLTVDECVIQGFRVKNSSAYLKSGIKVLSNNNTIKNNIISNTSFYGIELRSCFNNIVEDNYFLNNEWGLRLAFSCDNTILGNYFEDNWNGILIHNSSCNLIYNNTLHNNYYSVAIMFNSNKNNVTGNTITESYYGIDIFSDPGSCEYNKIQDNIIENSISYAIRVYICDYNIIQNNIINNSNSYGIRLYDSHRVIIKGNIINNCSVCGIKVYDSYRTFIQDNNITNNNCGILIDIGSFQILGGALKYYVFFLITYRGMLNKITHNNFIENNCSSTFLYGGGFTRWDSNYWDDWNGKSPYRIEGTGKRGFTRYKRDRHPQTDPY